MTEQIYYYNGKESFTENMPMRALLYGEGVFETFRCIDYKLPVFYERHICRLENGCRYLYIPLPEKYKISKFISESLVESHIEDAYVKLCILSNGKTHYSAIPNSSNLILIIKDYPEVREKVNITTAANRRDSANLIFHCKSLNYLENIILKRNIQKKGYDEAVFINDKDYVAECISHNIFWLRDDILVTPSSECGILPGVTRSALIDLVDSIGLKLMEGNFTIDELKLSSSVFITNSITGMAEVTSISGKNINSGGSLYKHIRQELLIALQWI